MRNKAIKKIKLPTELIYSIDSKQKRNLVKIIKRREKEKENVIMPFLPS
jgi:hypothetical protein